MTYNKELKPFARENRNNSTFGEILLWKNVLSRKQTGYQFNRQYPIENFIVDFISRSLKLVIEVDGYSHQFKYDTDIKRDKRLNELGYKVIRFTEHDVKHDFENVRRALNIYIEEFIENESIPLAPFSKGEEQEVTLPIIASKEEMNSIPLAPFSKGEEKMNAKLEIACFNLESALIAQQGGADRIELCDDFSSGGITPNYGTFLAARKLIHIPLFVMIRPRAINFIYTDNEFEQMKKDILYFKKMKADGFVFGILNEDGSVAVDKNKALVELAKPLPCSFHRAFDVSKNLQQNLEDVIACGFKTILTSGLTKAAMDGIENLIELLKQSNNRITIMPGGGVRSSNLELLKSKVETPYYHSSAIVKNDRADLEEVKLLKVKLS